MSFLHAGRWWSLPLIGVILTLGWATKIYAQEPIDENQPCLACHSNPDIVLEFSNGDSRFSHVSGATYNASVHGQEEMTCGGCHPDHQDYPHPEISAETSRDYTLQLNQTCLECHPDQAERVADSVHAQAMTEGNTDAAVCADCHGAHNTRSLHEARVAIATTCRQCHASVYDEYATSAHGKALTEEENTDVPSCIDCHGVHNVAEPHTTQFRLKSPDLCGSCHADETLMSQYNISTEVFQTYVADFHGTTVTLFEKQSPDAATNKAVCYDCHGVHAILPMDDPNAIAQNKENLLETCKKCHPDATTNFPDSWTSHHQPTFEKQPLVAAINMFYWIVIPATIGFMGIVVMSDAGRRIVGRVRRKSPATVKPDHSTPEDEA